ncbi:Endo-1,4-beta-xylanase Y precursor [Eubacteriaceae bacterium CHKCI004]|nr:Endo-1,4-beta-xylanase Y precursor [Eubacteriaceae bacterium CHKCI004]
MKKMLSLVLSLTIAAACMGCAAAGENTQNSMSETGAAEQTTQEMISAENETVQTTVTRAAIPETLAQVPEGYELPADQQGSIERLDYTTYESMGYEEQSEELEKTAYVYLPYEYNEEEQYNVFYLMHGGWSNETTMMGTDRSPSTLKNIVDHAIEDGRMQPMIIVCPTYNNTSPDDSSDYGLALQLTDNYHNELMNDLIPAVESRYSTFADDTTPEALTASRDHRAFGGFSMGSVTTWHTFQYCLDYFRYFMPMSGSLTTDGDVMNEMVEDAGYGPEDFFIFAMSGTDDFAYSSFTRQIEAMAAVPGGNFVEADNEQEGNLAYRVQEGGTHSGEYASQYIYNGLCWFWNE